jgi:hypothetical protein
MSQLSRTRAALGLLLIIIGTASSAQSVRDRIRLSRDKLTPISEEQAGELTLTLNEAAVRPLQVWVRSAGRVASDGRTITAPLPAHEAVYVRIGQRVRAFPPESRSSMFQARVTALSPDGTHATVVLSGRGHEGSLRYVVEIVTEPLESLSVPNEAIIESDGTRLVYVQVEPGRYEPRVIEPGLQGELYTEIRGGLKAGDRVVSFGSFFIDADQKLKGS